MADKPELKIGFIGMGLMGVPMTFRLLDAGFDVHVWNRSSSKLGSVIDAGAVAENSIRELVEYCDVVMLCLSDTKAVGQVVFGQEGIESAGSLGKILVDFSSIDPTQTQEFSAQLQDSCGMHWIDAPVSGGVAGAVSGELIIMAGGDAGVIESLAPVFWALSTRITHMGPVGSGQMTKLCNQMIVGCNALVISEMMALARRAGVAVEKIPGALAGGFADSKPFQILAPQMGEHDFTLKWRVKTVLKDLEGALKMSRELSGATPMLELGSTLMREHGKEGHMDDDLSTLILAYEEEQPS